MVFAWLLIIIYFAGILTKEIIKIMTLKEITNGRECKNIKSPKKELW